ncbi:hypothetical protein [Vibrio sp. PNB22_4_1]
MRDIIQHLKNQPLVWQVNLPKADNNQFLSSAGFPELDSLLGGDFPPNGVVAEQQSI